MNQQEKFWKGNFGKNYSKRSTSKKKEKSSTIFFKKILKKNYKINSILELGSNTGNNLIALNNLYRKARLDAVEINSYACGKMKKRLKKINVTNTSIEKFDTKSKYDLVFTKGVLIHINPKNLKKIYKKIYKFSSKYILISEYYNPYPTKVLYRGHKEKLFKRDFAGDFLNLFPMAKLIDYGFIYERDKYPEDNINWFLIKKR